jgi:hypothetical protein
MMAKKRAGMGMKRLSNCRGDSPQRHIPLFIIAEIAGLVEIVIRCCNQSEDDYNHSLMF